MYLDLTDVLRGPGATLEKSLILEPTTLDDLEIVEPVRGSIRVENARRNLVVSGRAQTAITLPCARCLQPSTQPLELEFEAVVPLRLFGPAGFSTLHSTHQHAPRDDDPSDDEGGEADDELAALFEGHTLDVLELVRQAIELQAPIKPLCRPDCPGLPEAAQYINAGGDERWGKLEHWKRDGKNGDAPLSSNNDNDG
jgi:uncharacterized protein